MKHAIDLTLTLPADADACDACEKRVVGVLEGRPGIERVHVKREEGAHAVLCVHFDPDVIPLARIEGLVARAGAELTSSYRHVSIPLAGLRHERQAKLVEGVFAREPGVLHAAVSFGGKRLVAAIDEKVTSRAKLDVVAKSAGVTTKEDDHEGHGHGHGDSGHGHAHAHGPFGERTELYFSLACGALTGVGWVLTRTAVPAAVTTALFVLAYLLGAWFTVGEAFTALRARRFEIDFLMLLAAAGAAILGEWFEGALLLFLFTLGHALEGFAMDRARKAIAALGELVPETALRFGESGDPEEVALAALVVGDRVLVKPNTRIPADGIVVAGASSVNQAPITGESVPVEKLPPADLDEARRAPDAVPAAHRVFAGTINGAQALTVLVTKAAHESTLARVVKMVTEAETQRSATQQLTDKFERVFVPVVLAIVVLTSFSWVVIDESASASFYRAMAMLVAASPCALAIATPSAVLSGIARAARGGVLIKGGAHLESLGRVTAIAFDKTGTLTEGRPKLTDVRVAEGATEAELLRIATAVEKGSDHPLASAVIEGAKSRMGDVALPEANDVEAIIGFGVRARVEGDDVLLGKPGLFDQHGGLSEDVRAAVDALRKEGRTVMVVRAGERFLGVLGVMDTPREGARDVVAALHRVGIEQTIMLSGDHQTVADAVAAEVGLRTARGDLLPEQKVEAVAALARTSGHVAMVGDGVNDAPAMAKATVGIAMGAGGSDVALETADVALMADDLRALPFAVALSRAATRIIRQNLFASLGMVAFLLPATFFGFASIGIAVAMHEGSTLLVVANALRLLAFRDVPVQPQRG